MSLPASPSATCMPPPEMVRHKSTAFLLRCHALLPVLPITEVPVCPKRTPNSPSSCSLPASELVRTWLLSSGPTCCWCGSRSASNLQTKPWASSTAPAVVVSSESTRALDSRVRAFCIGLHGDQSRAQAPSIASAAHVYCFTTAVLQTYV